MLRKTQPLVKSYDESAIKGWIKRRRVFLYGWFFLILPSSILYLPPSAALFISLTILFVFGRVNMRCLRSASVQKSDGTEGQKKVDT